MPLPLGSEALNDPIARHMRRDVTRLRVTDTVGEALISLRAQPPEGRIIYFYVVDGEGRLALLAGDLNRDLVRRRIEQALAAFTWRHPIAAAGAACLVPRSFSTRIIEPAQLRAAAADMLAQATPAGVQRVALE